LDGLASIHSASRTTWCSWKKKNIFPALQSAAGAVIAGEFATGSTGKPLLISSHPKLAFARAARFLQEEIVLGGKQAYTRAQWEAFRSFAPRVIVGERAIVADGAGNWRENADRRGCVSGGSKDRTRVRDLSNVTITPAQRWATG